MRITTAPPATTHFSAALTSASPKTKKNHTLKQRLPSLLSYWMWMRTRTIRGRLLLGGIAKTLLSHRDLRLQIYRMKLLQWPGEALSLTKLVRPKVSETQSSKKSTKKTTNNWLLSSSKCSDITYQQPPRQRHPPLISTRPRKPITSETWAKKTKIDSTPWKSWETWWLKVALLAWFSSASGRLKRSNSRPTR